MLWRLITNHINFANNKRIDPAYPVNWGFAGLIADSLDNISYYAKCTYEKVESLSEYKYQLEIDEKVVIKRKLIYIYDYLSDAIELIEQLIPIEVEHKVQLVGALVTERNIVYQNDTITITIKINNPEP